MCVGFVGVFVGVWVGFGKNIDLILKLIILDNFILHQNVLKK